MKAKKENEAATIPGTLQIDVPVLYFVEDGVFFASIPALDLTGYGQTEEEAEVSLKIMLDEFFKYTTENNTLESELARLGWKKSPPALMTSLQGNSQLQNIVNHQPFKANKFHLQMPAYN